MSVEEVPLRHIAGTLMQASIASPAGRPNWGISTLAHILSNPAYRGEYVELRTQRVEPKARLGAIYGLSTHRPRDKDGHVPLPGLITKALVTPEECTIVQERLAWNKAQEGKVVQRYLLRDMVRCEHCGRHWQSKVDRTMGHTYYRYVCNGTEDRSDGHPLYRRIGQGSQELEWLVWRRVGEFLAQPRLFLATL